MLGRFKNPRLLAICAILAAISFVIYARTLGHDFVEFDDQDYITQNNDVQKGLTWEGVYWAFVGAHACNWHPLTWISHMLDVELFGLRPGWHHLTNVLFHIANSILLFLLLNRITKLLWPSAIAACLFGVHPLHVESVAWISERKDLLSAFFFFATYSRLNSGGTTSSDDPLTINSRA